MLLRLMMIIDIEELNLKFSKFMKLPKKLDQGRNRLRVEESVFCIQVGRKKEEIHFRL